MKLTQGLTQMTALNFPDILSALNSICTGSSKSSPTSCPLYFYEANSGMLFLKHEHKVQPLLLIDDGSDRALTDLRTFAPQLISPKTLMKRFGLQVEKFLGQINECSKKLPVFHTSVKSKAEKLSVS